MTVRLPDDLAEQLRREAFERHVSQASIIEEALRRWFGEVRVPTTAQGATSGVHTSPQFQQYLQQVVQEAILRYGTTCRGEE